MTKISYNIEDKGWKKHFPHFKKYIGEAVNETLKPVSYTHLTLPTNREV